MAVFSLVDDGATVTVAGGNTRLLAITDDGWYDCVDEVGHESADFSDLYAIQILDSSGVELVVLSDLTGADAGVYTPAEAGVAPIGNAYTVTADGRYKFNLVTVPTYGAGTAYVYSWSNDVYVYYSSKVYKLIQSGTGKTPDSETAYWTEQFDVDVTDMATMIAGLPAKYTTAVHQYSSVDAEALWPDMMYRVHTAQGVVGDDAVTMLNNREWKDAAQLYLDLRALPGHLTNANYEAMDDIFTRAAALVTKYA